MTQDTKSETGICVRKVGDKWTFYAEGVARMETPELGELRAYIYGVWDGITGCTGQRPNHVCPIYSESGVMLDTLRSIPAEG